MHMNKAPQGIILYRGPSTIDGAPIAAVATGLIKPSSNAKTGPLVQVYIIRSDVHPSVAVHRGDDASICGDCVHRGAVEVGSDGKRRSIGRSCYVTLLHGPSMVYDALERGFYTEASPQVARRALAGRMMRIGAYGDPAAVPETIWDVVLDRVGDLTAYTHLWRRYPTLSSFCMASVDTPEERDEAKALGFRTYRVRRPGDPLFAGEGRCPASKELGSQVQCAQCMLCGGTRTKAKADITIEVHGTGASNFIRSAA
jgi:hypothetical protein